MPSKREFYQFLKTELSTPDFFERLENFSRMKGFSKRDSISIIRQVCRGGLDPNFHPAIVAEVMALISFRNDAFLNGMGRLYLLLIMSYVFILTHCNQFPYLLERRIGIALSLTIIYSPILYKGFLTFLEIYFRLRVPEWLQLWYESFLIRQIKKKASPEGSSRVIFNCIVQDLHPDYYTPSTPRWRVGQLQGEGHLQRYGMIELSSAEEERAYEMLGLLVPRAQISNCEIPPYVGGEHFCDTLRKQFERLKEENPWMEYLAK
ncbi:MAG: hypothetical protein EOP06_03740 [Proteobacteria bacterium]|nr:MAG: hypothetical protein EOP06_03740 [Pseudomonadota bacterium]